MPGDALYLVNQDGIHEIPGMPPGQGRDLVPHAAGFLGLFAGGPARVYWPSDTALKIARQNAIKMRSDASVMECVELRQRATALLDWRLECDADEPEYQEARLLLEKILRRIPRFMQYRENLLHALWFGRYAVANRFAWDWIDGQKVVTVASWIPVHGDKLVWKITGDVGDLFDGLGVRVGGISGLVPEIRRWQEEHRPYIEATEYGWAYFPPPGKREVLVVHRHYIEDGEYEEPRNAGRVFGVGIRDRIYWTWYQKQDALAWLMEFLERSAFGIELWYYPSGNPQAREELRQAAAERAGPNKNILLVPRPPGMEGAVYGVERIEPSLAGAQALKEIITDYFGHQIKRYILGQTLTTEAHATGLGSNLASIHLDTFLQIVRYDAINLQETLTEQLVRRLAGWNFPHLDGRAFRFVIELEKDDTQQRLEALQAAFNMGLKIRAADLRDLLEIAEPGPEEEFLQNPAYRQFGEGGPPGSVPAAPAVPPTAAPTEKYTLPPGLPKNPQPGQRVTINGKTYAYIPNREGDYQWQVEDRSENPNLRHHVYVSSNKEVGLTLAQARKKLRSPEHQQFRQRAEQICHEEGIKPVQILDALGNWTTGSENSLVLEFTTIPEKILDKIAARLGKEYDQEAVAKFFVGGDKVSIRWVAQVSLASEQIVDVLDRCGIEYRTVIESQDRNTVVICGEYDAIHDKCDRARAALRKYNLSDQLACGRFSLIWRGEYDRIIEGRSESEKMSQSNQPWFMDDNIVNGLSDKTKALVRIVRDCYRAERLSPQEMEERERRIRMWVKKLREGGCVVNDGSTDGQSSVII